MREIGSCLRDMNNSIFVTIVSLLVFLLSSEQLSLAGDFRITRVYDGDSIKAEGHDIEIKVRLIGIDAPETSRRKRDPGQPFSQRSRKYLSFLVLNKDVNIQGFGLDRYNRILGEISLSGKNINLEMIKAGMAEVYRGRHPKGFDPTTYMQIEIEAQASERGMWSLANEYISPRDWRAMKKNK